MGPGKNRTETLLQELIAMARGANIEVRTERLLREVGYHARSGRCRVRGKELIIIDRDLPVRDQVDLLATELKERARATLEIPPHLRFLLRERSRPGY